MNVLDELERAGAILLDRHFVYKSGKHGSGYINMDPLFSDILLLRELGKLLYLPFWGGYTQVPETIAAPATGGILLSAFTANEVAGHRPPRAVWADKDGDDFAFQRAGFVEHLQGKRVLVVEDLLTTGGSVQKVCRAAESHGANIIGVSAVCNRGGVTAEQLGVPRLESLTVVGFEAVEADDCLLCRVKAPIVRDIGHGAKFMAAHPDYPGGFITLLS
ncbi:hypothetical protein COU91_00485 [Candidatus Saccharibacteria bacterium CG10_big_fil_rev_8_21_14_0_10_47_8]|nr:MAG: hypothetical protein COU91_00485 [Candidatus Saccharibacteria bacterium CG10_big_fil_rev_8_21_14_0_10_47_8]